MAAPPTTLCDLWLDAERLSECCSLDDYTEDQVTRAIRYASLLLFRLTGRRWPGVCTDEVAPCLTVNTSPFGRVYVGSYGWGGWTPAYVPVHSPGGWQNLSTGGCCHMDCLSLPGPIVEIIEVRVDSVVLDPSAYEVKGWGSLCRIDGQQWPVATPPGDETFTISWTRGREIPEDAADMAAILACNRIAQLSCIADCDMNTNGLASISADGVTRDFQSLQQTGSTPGLTGVAIVDEWIRSVNPYGRQRRAVVVDVMDRSRGSAKFT